MNRVLTRLLAAIGCLALLLAVRTPAPLAAARTGPLSEEEVRAAVETWVRGVPVEARPDAAVAEMEPYLEGGEVAAYIAHLTGGGFVLAGADLAVLPVYFYSPHGTYDPAVPDYRTILHQIAAREQAAQEALAAGGAPAQSWQEVLPYREAYWEELIAGRTPAPPAAPEGPLAEPGYLLLPLTARWDQGAPYFDYLPVLTPGTQEHTLVGCNATATAQIMYYWKWPPTGTGSSCVSYPYRYRTDWISVGLASGPTIPPEYAGRLVYDATNHQLRMSGYWDDSIYGAAQKISSASAFQTALATLWNIMTQASKNACADFSAASFNWGIVRDSNTEPADAAGAQAALISAWTAIGVDSGLGVWGTGSYFGNDVAGLVDHFRYDSDALFTPGPGATIAGLTSEITWGRVAGLGGGRADGAGHAWVIDGYDKSTDPNRLLHMNLGWGGSSNGWYTWDDRPFPLNNDMMTHIAPASVKFALASWIVPGDGSPNSPYLNITQAAGSVPAGNTLMLRAGSEYNFSGSLVIDRAMTIKGFGATIR
jgi:hypothetical protein